jgi:HSP20 family protein
LIYSLSTIGVASIGTSPVNFNGRSAMTLATRLNRGSSDPFSSVGLDSFVRQVFSPEAPRHPYGVDVYEDAEHLHLDAELPGFTRDQIDVTIDDGVLTITAERPAPTVKPDVPNGSNAGSNGETSQPTWHARERRAARLARSFSLPKTVDGTAGVEAKLADGVLHLTLSKRPELKPRKITIA